MVCRVSCNWPALVSKMVSNLFEHLFNVYETSLASNDSQISVFSNTVDAPWQGIAGTEPRTAVKAKNHHQTCTSTKCCHWCSAPTTPGSRGKIILIKTTNIWLACFQCHPALSQSDKINRQLNLKEFHIQAMK